MRFIAIRRTLFLASVVHNLNARLASIRPREALRLSRSLSWKAFKAYGTAGAATQGESKPISGCDLPKTGIFRHVAGDYRLFRAGNGQIPNLETDSQFPKARHWRAFLRLLGAVSPSAGLSGWGGRIRTSIRRIGHRALSPVQEKPQNLFPSKFLSSSKHSNLKNRTESKESRASERNGPFGEQQADTADQGFIAQRRNRCCYWAYLPTSSLGERKAWAKLAEGEQLGSNLLHVAHRSRRTQADQGCF